MSAARVAMWSAVGFLAAVATLHVVQPGLDPSWRVLSEYSFGEHGWLMVLAFALLGVGHVALFVAVRSQVRTVAGRFGLAALLAAAAGLFMAALFTTDPITTPPDARTAEGGLHHVAGTLGMGMPIAAALVSWSLARHPAWTWARGRLLATAALACLAALAFMIVAAVSLSRSGGVFGPEVPIGWPNRIDVLAHCTWLLTTACTREQVARHALQVRPPPEHGARPRPAR